MIFLQHWIIVQFIRIVFMFSLIGGCMTLEELTARLREELQRRPANAGSLKFSLKSAGFIYVSGTSVSNEDLPADCTLVISKRDLDALVDGSLDTQTAMMSGRLELHGDIGVAAEMQSVFTRAWEMR